MHSSRNIVRQPSVYRVIRAPAATRQMSIFGPSPFFPRFAQPSVPSFNHGFNDLFRMMDDFAATARTFDHFTAPARLHAVTPTFQPRFDIREQNGVYELRGELPGVKTENLEVEFTDAQTLVIRGKTEQESTRGNVPSAPQPAAVEAAIEPTPAEAVNTVATDNSDTVSVGSNTSYQKPTVEDEDAAAEVQSIASSAPGQATPAESVAEEQTPITETQTVQATATQQPQPSTQQQQPESRYWVSERSVGSFQRVFQFPTRVDHDNIKASLKDGLLSITIPKAQAPGVKRINVL